MLDKVVVVKRATQLEELLRRHATESQVKFYLESRGDSYDFYKQAHAAYHLGLQQTLAAIPHTLRSQVVDKEYLPTFQFAEKDAIVVVGDDGLFVNVAKYVGEQPVILVNANSEQFDGVLATCTPKEFSQTLKATLQGSADIEKLTMAEAKLDNGQVLYALNDIYVGKKTHVSSRYLIEHEGRKERHSSSGVIICTGTGSTGWMSSVAAQTRAYGAAGPQVPFPRTSPYLLFHVREPFASKITGTSIVRGIIAAELRITSQMPEDGVIFSDGIEADYLEFTAGRSAIIQPSTKKVHRVNHLNTPQIPTHDERTTKTTKTRGPR